MSEVKKGGSVDNGLLRGDGTMMKPLEGWRNYWLGWKKRYATDYRRTRDMEIYLWDNQISVN